MLRATSRATTPRGQPCSRVRTARSLFMSKRAQSPAPPRPAANDDQQNTQGSKPSALAEPHSAPLPHSPTKRMNPPSWQSRIKGLTLGLDMSPELIAISMVYFTQGVLGLARLGISFFLKDELQLDPAEVALIGTIAGLPWIVKPLYGFVSDSFPIGGYRRRPYLVLAGLLGTVGWALLASPQIVNSSSAAAAAMVVASLSTASSDVLVDSIVVERARGAPESTAGSLQSLCWGSSAVGGILSAYWSGSLVEAWGPRAVFALTALFPLVVSCSALLISEQRIPSSFSSNGSSWGWGRGKGSSSPPGGPGAGLTTDKSNSGLELGDLHASQWSGHQSYVTDQRDRERQPLLGEESHVQMQPLTQAQSESQHHVHHSPHPHGSPLLHAADSLFGDRLGAAGLRQPETSHEPRNSAPMQAAVVPPGRLKALWGAVTQKAVLLPTLFVFVWQATPSAESAMFFFQTNELGFTPEFLGRVRLVSALASLGGVILYNTCLKKVPLRTILWWAMLMGVALGSTQLLLVTRANVTLGLSDQLFVLGDSALLTVLGQASFMPILVLAARLCPEGVEATLFATLMSVLNGGAAVSSFGGAALTNALGVTSENFDNLWILVLLCNIAQLLPAPLLGLLPASLEVEDDDSKGANSMNSMEDGKQAGSPNHDE